MTLIPPAVYFPEMLQFEDSADSMRALMRARKANHPVWFVVLVILVGFAVINITFFAWYALGSIAGTAVMLLRMFLQISSSVLVGTATMFLANRLWRRRIRRSLREQLQERGVPICVPCGYDLRGQRESRCPECGHPFDPRLLSESTPDAGAAQGQDE